MSLKYSKSDEQLEENILKELNFDNDYENDNCDSDDELNTTFMQNIEDIEKINNSESENSFTGSNNEIRAISKRSRLFSNEEFNLPQQSVQDNSNVSHSINEQVDSNKSNQSRYCVVRGNTQAEIDAAITYYGLFDEDYKEVKNLQTQRSVQENFNVLDEEERERNEIIRECNKYQCVYPDIDSTFLVPTEILQLQNDDVPDEIKELCRTQGFISATKFLQVSNQLHQSQEAVIEDNEENLNESLSELSRKLNSKNDLNTSLQLLSQKLNSSDVLDEYVNNAKMSCEKLKNLEAEKDPRVKKIIVPKENFGEIFSDNLDTQAYEHEFLNLPSLPPSSPLVPSINHEITNVQESNKSTSTFGGFSFLSGRNITVNREIAKKYEEKFHNLQYSQKKSQQNEKSEISNQQPWASNLGGFSFASGRSITVNQKVSKEIQEKFLKMSQDEKEKREGNESSTTYKGFSFASGKGLKVNEKLAKEYAPQFKDLSRSQNISNNQSIEKNSTEKSSLSEVKIDETSSNKKMEKESTDEEEEREEQNDCLQIKRTKLLRIMPKKSSVDEFSQFKKGFQTPKDSKEDIFQLTNSSLSASCGPNSPLSITSARSLISLRRKRTRKDTHNDFSLNEPNIKRQSFAPTHASSPMVTAPVTPDVKRPFKTNQLNFFNISPSPIAPTTSRRILNNENDKENEKKSKMTFSQRFSELSKYVRKKPSNNTFDDDFEEMLDEKTLHSFDTAVRLKIERDAALDEQIKYVNDKPASDCRRMQGTLFMMKCAKGRKSLYEFLNNEKPIKRDFHKVDRKELINFVLDVNAYCDDVTKINSITVGDNVKVVLNCVSKVGFREIKYAFLSSLGVEPKLIKNGWLENAYERILEKLIYYENNFNKIHKFEVLNIETVMQQLKYRYDREIDLNQRSAIQKIAEADESPKRRMVLKITDVFNKDGNIELELSDGWYLIRAVIDKCISNAITKRKIGENTKIITSGAFLLNSNRGSHPLELPSGVKLQLHGNSTRIADYRLKLGFYRDPSPLYVTLNSLKGDGGSIGKIRVFVSHVYSVIFIEDKGDKKDFRSEKMQMRINSKNELLYSRQFEVIYEKVVNDFQKSLKVRVEELKKKPFNALTNEEISDIIENEQNSLYGERLWSKLTIPQHQAVIQRREDLKVKFREEAIEKMQEFNENKTIWMLKFRVVDARKPEKTALISWFHPHEDVLNCIKEGSLIELIDLKARESTYNELQLIASNQTTLHVLKQLKDVDEKYYEFLRKPTELFELALNVFKPPNDEFDIACIILRVDDRDEPGNCQRLYVVDDKKNFLCIKFIPNISEYAYENILKEGELFYIRNLQWRNSLCDKNKSLPEAYAVPDTTTFFVKPKRKDQQIRLIDFCANVNDPFEYHRTCCELLHILVGPPRIKLKLTLEENPQLARIFTNRQYGKKCAPRRFHF